MPRAAAWATRNAPLRLVSKTLSQTASSHVERRAGARDAGVVDEDVETRAACTKGRIDAAPVGDVEIDGAGRAAGRLDLGTGEVERLPASGRQGHANAAPREDPGEMQPEAPGRAGDERRLAVEIVEQTRALPRPGAPPGQRGVLARAKPRHNRDERPRVRDGARGRRTRRPGWPTREWRAPLRRAPRSPSADRPC